MNLCFVQERGNAITIDALTGNIQDAYSYLASSNRNSQLGALSATNRRTLILLPGIYPLTTALTLNTDYVDIVAIGDSPSNTIVCKGTSGAVVIQTCADARLYNFTIKHLSTSRTLNDHGFLINAATNNNASYYENMYFRHAYPSLYLCYPVFGATDLGGTWRLCQGDDYSWRAANNKNVTATMYDCIAGIFSYGGDNENNIGGTGVVSGNFYRCSGGASCFGACSTWGQNCTGLFVDCTAGAKSFAIGKNFSGIAIRCKAGASSFGGYAGTLTYYGTMSGTCIDCEAEGSLYSFGCGNAGSVLSGSLIRCRNGSAAESGAGISWAYATTPPAKTYASLTTQFAAANSNLVFTAKKIGPAGNFIYIILANTSISSGLYCTVSTTIPTTITVKWKTSDGIPTAAAVKAKLEETAAAMNLISVAYAPGNDGSGQITSMLTPGTPLAGGVGGAVVKNCQPFAPTSCMVSGSVYYFDNGHVFHNGDATTAVTLTLPAAINGFEYNFEVRAAQSFVIQRAGTDTFSDTSTSKTCATVGARLKVKCLIDGKWEFETVGTWT